MILETLLSIPEYGVAGFINHTDKTFYVVQSKELPCTIARNIKLLRNKEHSIQELQTQFNAGLLSLELIRSLPDNTGDMALRAHANECVDALLASGYRNLRPYSSPGHYKLKIDVMKDFRSVLVKDRNYTKEFLVYVMAESRNHEKTVLGIFETLTEANEWVNNTYGDNKDRIIPKTCDNYLTKLFLQAGEQTVITVKKKRKSRNSGVKNTL